VNHLQVILPPKEPCATVWPLFVRWLIRKMSEDAMIDSTEDIPIVDVTFRQHAFTVCPFCALPLDPDDTRPLAKRHP
jgi:hypothetical protein